MLSMVNVSSIIFVLMVCVYTSIIHGAARIFTSLLLQVAPGIFAGLPTHTPYAFALAAISVLFSNEELGSSLLFKSKRVRSPVWSRKG